MLGSGGKNRGIIRKIASLRRLKNQRDLIVPLPQR
jgi:hypothetical protein